VRDAFIQRGIPFLNESRRFGGVAVGDIIAEPITHGIQALLCLAVGERGPVVYDRAREFMESLNGSQGQSDFDEADAERHLRRAVASLADFVRSAVPTDAAAMIDAAIAEVGENAIRKTYPSMRGSYFAEFSEALRRFSTDLGRDASSWSDLANELLGGDKVRLLTIHKSKGMEFHTVVVMGVHSRAFRSLDGDEMNTFFVALSRAKERVFFTRSAQSGGRQVLRSGFRSRDEMP
jgi:superfamily I DNA/RNA helicase